LDDPLELRILELPLITSHDKATHECSRSNHSRYGKIKATAVDKEREMNSAQFPSLSPFLRYKILINFLLAAFFKSPSSSLLSRARLREASEREASSGVWFVESARKQLNPEAAIGEGNHLLN